MATAATGPPLLAQASAIRERSASDVLRRRTHPCRTCRSWPLSISDPSFGLATPNSLVGEYEISH